MMNKISHVRSWCSDTVEIHAKLPLVPLIKINLDLKSEKYYVKIKLCRKITSEKLDTYELKTNLFENGKPEEYLLIVQNYKIALEAPWTLTQISKLQ